MEQKEDLRIQKTYDALSGAFQELITEKTFDKITVRELCSRARIRTATFYTHFSDKYDFADCMLRRINQQYFNDSILAASVTEPEQYISYIVRSILDFLEEKEDFLLAVEANSLLVPTIDLITKEMGVLVRETFQLLAEKGTTLSTDPELLSELFIGAVSQICRWWFDHKKEISKEELMEKLSVFLPKMLFQ